MSKVITSPIKRWAGTVTIADPLTISQAESIQDGFDKDVPPELAEAREKYFSHVKENGDENAEAVRLRLSLIEIAEKYRTFHTVIDRQRIPALFACVEKWDLQNMPENLTAENFPASPRGDSHKLIEWIFGELRNVYFGESEVPNE